MQHQFNVMKPVEETRVHHAHDMGKVQGAVGARGPAAISSKEFSRARMSQQSFHWFFEIHVPKGGLIRKKSKWGVPLNF